MKKVKSRGKLLKKSQKKVKKEVEKTERKIKNLEENVNDNIAKALYRKAVGYTAKEIVEEYGGESGELLKRKVSKKHIPPDMTALKTFIELDKSRGDIANMSDEELEKTKIKLLKELEENDNQEKSDNQEKKEN